MRISSASPFFQRMDRFLYSPVYFLLVGGLTILSNVFCLEWFAYPAFLLIGIFICLFGRDLLPLFPLFACGYISPSAGNNPGVNENSIFSVSGGFLYLFVLLVALAGCLVYRLITDPDFGGKKFLYKKRTLLPGMLVLGICYTVSGLASGQWETYGLRNLLFSFIQLVAVAGLYYLLSGAVRWDLAPKGYLFWTGMCVGYVLLAELVGIYVKANVIVDGVIFRDRIVTGWGHYNNIGAMFAMMIPLPFFLTGKGKLASVYYLSAFLFSLGMLFTCSRGSILVGFVVYAAAYILSLFHSGNARKQIPVHIFTVAVPIVILALFYSELTQLFKELWDAGLRSQERFAIYVEGFRQFLKFPVFGGSFFPVEYWPYSWSTSEAFLKWFPPRWHNTFVQLLATGGVSLLAGYVLHRVQTVKLFVKNFNTGKLFAGLTVLALLLTSLVDCHFFNIGPVLFYSALLAFVEHQTYQRRLKRPKQ